jgi:hypothetical protein
MYMFQHNSGMPGAISTKLGAHMTIYIYIYKWMYSLVKKEVWNRVLSWCNSHFFCHQSSHIFIQSLQNIAVVFGTNWLFVNSLLSVKEIDEHALDFALHLSGLFRSALNRVCHSFIYGSCHCKVTLFPRFAQNKMLFLCRIHHQITSGQIHNSK